MPFKKHVLYLPLNCREKVYSVPRLELCNNGLYLKAINRYNWLTTFSCHVLYLMNDISTFLAANQLNELRELKYIHTFAIQ